MRFLLILAALLTIGLTVPPEFMADDLNEHICRFGISHDDNLMGNLAIDLEGKQPHYAPDRHVDVLHIKLDVTPDFRARTVAGTTTLTFTPIGKPLRELRLDAVHLTVSDVQSSEPISDYTSTEKDLTIAFDPPVNVGKEAKLEIRHSAQPKRGFYFRIPEMGYPVSDTHCWTQGEAHEARFWFPCFDYPNERSSTEIICHVPEDMTVLSNGRRISERLDPATGLKTVHWLQEKPHVNYLICLVAGYFEKLEKKHRDVQLGFYTQPSLYEHAENSFRDTDHIMAFFEEEIGIPFPWDKYDQVTIRDFVAGGMENTTLTTLTHRTVFTTATENIRSTRRLDAHELAHQWFGDYVTCKDWSHLWLNEGFAVYYAHLYEGHKFGRDAMLYGLYRNATGVLSERSDHKPIVWKGYTNAMQQFDYRAYPKGAWVLHMLRSQLGADLYRQCIKTFLERHALTSVVTEDLNKIIEELSGRSFDPFFDQWVYHARHPDLKITYRWLPSEKLARVTVEQTQETNDDVLLFKLPTQLRFILDDNTVDHPIQIDQRKHDFYVPLAKEPAIVRFDPDFTLLADVDFKKPDEMLFAQLENAEDMIGRLRAAKALGGRDTHASVEHLQKTLREDPFFGVRIAASSALENIHNDGAFTALSSSFEQPDARVRLQVVEDLSKFYRSASQDQLASILDAEENPAIQAAAIRGLGRFHGETTQTLLAKYLRSDSFRNELANAAVDAIRELADPSAGRELIDVLGARERQFTTRGIGNVLNTLAHISQDQDQKTPVRRFILRYLDHPRRRIRVAAVRALGTLRDPEAKSVLDTLAGKGRQGRLAKAAQAALKKLQETAPLVPEELIELRKVLTQLKDQNDKLHEEVKDLKQKVEATDRSPVEQTDKEKPNGDRDPTPQNDSN